MTKIPEYTVSLLFAAKSAVDAMPASSCRDDLVAAIVDFESLMPVRSDGYIDTEGSKAKYKGNIIQFNPK